jgi:phenylalanyl-tRNA synthetase beta chain
MEKRMPTVNLNKQEVLNLIGKDLNDETLREEIPMLGTDLEDITYNEIIVEIFPNRPDMLSEQGFARALASFLNIKPGLRTYKVNKSNEKLIVEDSVKEVRPYTACAIIKNLDFTEEKIKQIIQIQEKLHISYGRNRKKVAIGIYPFEKIKTPITFKALPPNEIKFQPLEHPTELTGNEILEKHPTGKEYKHLLKDKKLFPIFIDANNKILSMPPIINSDDIGKVTNNTKEVFIECSGFDYKVLSKCLNIIITALADMGGEIYSMELDLYGKKVISPNLEPQRMKLDLDYVNKRLSLNLKEKEIKDLLSKMGIDYKKEAIIPAYRADIIHPIDLIEEIAIAHGYENFEPIIPEVSTIAEENKLEIFKRKLSNLLIGFKLLETSSLSLISEEDLIKSNLNIKNLKVINAVTEEYDTLRPSLIPSLLKILSQNKHNEYPQNIFEINKIFTEKKEEPTNLCITLCNEHANFTKVKQILDSIFSHLELKYEIKEIESETFIPGRTAEIIYQNNKIGLIGEVSPETLTNFDIQMPVSILEININHLT